VSTNTAAGAVLFAYDGSDLAKLAINETGLLLDTAREALVLTVWQPLDVGFVPADGRQFDAAQITEVRAAAEDTAAQGASLAGDVGFRARGLELEAAPTWKGIIHVADEHDASAIVLGSRGQSRLTGVLVGSVALAVASHARRTVLIVHPRTP
jgi:nucleotide-binding universal stress UspA family protein